VTVSDTDGLNVTTGIAQVGAAMLAMIAAMMMRFICVSVNFISRRKTGLGRPDILSQHAVCLEYAVNPKRGPGVYFLHPGAANMFSNGTRFHCLKSTETRCTVDCEQTDRSRLSCAPECVPLKAVAKRQG
jgi:hypothetical protein